MAPTPESAAFLAKKPSVPPTFDGVDYDDTARLKQAQDAIIREQWVKSMMARLVREELGKCYYKEGIPAGTILQGLNFLKGRDDPVALKEEEYPEWLWHCLDEKKAADGGATAGGDEFSKSKKLRRAAAKARRKAEERALLSGDTSLLEVKVPLQQQSVDLSSEGEAALEQRGDLVKAMRKERRAKIKEGNYLKGM
ncbi:ribosomal protein subunit l37 [Botrytis cinerea]